MKDVLISGAGIAGPALAHWLHEYGFRPTIVELAPTPRPGGQTVDIRGIAREVVEKMGLMPAIRSRQLHERGLAYVGADGRRQAAMPADLFDGAGPVAEIEILRGDLCEILLDATAQNVEYVYDDSITDLTQDDQGVLVTFTRHRSGGSTWSSAPTGCTRAPGRSRSAPSRRTCNTWVVTAPSSPSVRRRRSTGG